MNKINLLRKEIDRIDSQLINLLDQRFDLCIEIGQIKKETSSEVLNQNREIEILERLSKQTKHQGMVKHIWPYIMAFSKYLQKNLGD